MIKWIRTSRLSRKKSLHLRLESERALLCLRPLPRRTTRGILELRAVLNWYSSQFKSNHFTEMCCGTEAGSYLRLIDSCITQRKAQGPSRICNESKEEEEEEEVMKWIRTSRLSIKKSLSAPAPRGRARAPASSTLTLSR